MKVEKVGRSAPEIKDIVAATRLSPLIAYSLDTGDKGLISVLRRGDIRKLVVSIFRYQRPLSPLMMWHRDTSAHCRHLPYL